MVKRTGLYYVNDFKMHRRVETRIKNTIISYPQWPSTASAHSREKWHPFVKPPKDQFSDVVLKYWYSRENFKDFLELIWETKNILCRTAPHTTRSAIQWLADHFGENVVSHGTVNPWAPHSPYLNALYVSLLIGLP